jgi:hypothetical protein
LEWTLKHIGGELAEAALARVKKIDELDATRMTVKDILRACSEPDTHP